MIQKTTLRIIRIIFSIILGIQTGLNAQTIVPQPLEGVERLCAGNSFNEFFASFRYVNFSPEATFAVELLDNSNNPIATTLLQTIDVSVTQKTIKFAVPVTLVGSDSYGIRVKSSTGTISPRFKNAVGETSFAVYYKEFESTFSINNEDTNAVICSGGSLTLSVDNATPTVLSSSPANYPKLKYKWFKDNKVIEGQSGKTLTLNTLGNYYAIIDYGACTDINFSSNDVNVSGSSSGPSLTISSSLGNPFCSGGTGTILTTAQGNIYKWYRDNDLIPTATTRSITVNEFGLYKVEVDFGGCNGTGTIDLQSIVFNASIDVADDFALEQGETVNVSITTDAAAPTYEWYLDDNLISGATTSSYLVTVIGNYKVKISQESGCVASKEFTFQATGKAGPSSVIPNIIKLSSSNPYWNIPDEYKNSTTKVMIIGANGDMVLDVFDYKGDWPQASIDFKNVNPVYYYVIQSDTAEKKGSITVIK